MEQGTVLGFQDYRDQGEALAAALGLPYREVEIHRFPDGESRVRVPPLRPGKVIFCRSLDRPNDKLVELMLAAATARRDGADTLVLVAPYLCYMRQDMAFNPGEAVSQHIVGGYLAELFDEVITVDPHLHRVRNLVDAIPARRVQCLSAAGAIGDFLVRNVRSPLLLGPDGESEQWVQVIARDRDLEYGLAHKIRHGDREVTIELPAVDFKYRHVVLIDDMASTGRTLGQAALAVQARGATRVSAVITHGLFAGDALAYLRGSGIEAVWSTDSVAHATNAIPLADLLAEGVGQARPRLASSA